MSKSFCPENFSVAGRGRREGPISSGQRRIAIATLCAIGVIGASRLAFGYALPSVSSGERTLTSPKGDEPLSRPHSPGAIMWRVSATEPPGFEQVIMTNVRGAVLGRRTNQGIAKIWRGPTIDGGPTLFVLYTDGKGTGLVSQAVSMFRYDGRAFGQIWGHEAELHMVPPTSAEATAVHYQWAFGAKGRTVTVRTVKQYFGIQRAGSPVRTVVSGDAEHFRFDTKRDHFVAVSQFATPLGRQP